MHFIKSSKMKSNILIIFCSLFLSNLQGQNLIKNGGFEEYYSLPTNVDQLEKCKYWKNSNPISVMEYWNLDGYSSSGTSFQGKGYVGFQTYWNKSLYSDFIQQFFIGELQSNLLKNNTYKFSMWVARFYPTQYATEIDVLFTSSNNILPKPIPNRAHLRTNIIELSIASGYSLIEHTFVSDSNYSNITIGALFDSANITVKTITGSSSFPYAYYFLDNVSLVDVSPIQPTITGIRTICDTLALKENTYFQAQGEALQWALPYGLTASITGLNTSISGVSINFTSAGIYTLTVNSTNQYGTLSALHIVTVVGCTTPTIPGIQTCLGQYCTKSITCTGSNCANCFGIVCTLPSLPCGGVCPENATCVSNVCTSLTSPLPTCTGVSCDTVIIPPVEPLRVFKIYNTFTPNGDGINDTWVIDSLYPPNKITILDKWGNLLYEVSPYTNDWDGNRDGSRLPSGTYYFILEYGDKKRQAGVVNIIR